MPDAPSPPALTRADREQMLLSVENLVKLLVRKSGLPKSEFEDAAQEMMLELWRATEMFDPTRGVKWSTYAAATVNRVLHTTYHRQMARRSGELLLESGEWARMTTGGVVAEERDETADALFDAVQRQLTGGLLDALTPKAKASSGERALPAREIVEGVAFRGLTCDNLATQTGQHPKAVKTNLKNALRRLKKRGLTQHVATDAQVEAILAPDPGKKHCNKPRVRKVEHVLPDPMKAAVVPAGGVPQERGCPPDPTEAAPCSTSA